MSNHFIPNSSEVADLYDKFTNTLAAIWDENLHYGYWSGPADTATVSEATNRFTTEVTGHLHAGPGDQVLDVGCGLGKPAIDTARTTGAVVTGISISSYQITRATERAQRQKVDDQVHFQLADAMDMPFPDNSFDAVMALESMQHMPDRGQVLREAARVVRPGGRLVLTDLLLRRPPDGPDAVFLKRACQTLPISYIPAAEYTGLVENAGLRLERLDDITDNILPTFPALVETFVAAWDAVVSALGDEGANAMLDFWRDSPAASGTAGYLLLVAAHP